MIIHQFVPVSMSQTSARSRKLNTTSKLVFVSFPVNKRLRKANNEDHCLVHHLRFGMRNRLKKDPK